MALTGSSHSLFTSSLHLSAIIIFSSRLHVYPITTGTITKSRSKKKLCLLCLTASKASNWLFPFNPSWSRLPEDLLLLIGKRLNTRLDTLRLRSVCTSWRSSVPPFKRTPPFPLTLPFPFSPNPALHPKRTGHFCLSESPILFFPPPDDQTVSKFWLLRVEERGNGKFHPINPLFRYPMVEVVQNSPEVLNMMNARAFEMGKGFSLDFVETSNIVHNYFELKSLVIQKFAVSSHPCTPNGDDFEVVAIQDGKLGFIKSGDEKWSLVDHRNKYADVAYYNGKFYAVECRSNRTVVFDSVSGLEVKKVAPASLWGGDFKYLVVSKEGLFMIHKDVEFSHELRWGRYVDMNKDNESHFKVYKLNEERNVWKRVHSLGDEVFFVGDNCTYCVSVQDFPGLKHNHIYFGKHFLDDPFEGSLCLCFDFSVYRMEDDKGGALDLLEGRSNFFWPPPAWLL